MLVVASAVVTLILPLRLVFLVLRWSSTVFPQSQVVSEQGTYPWRILPWMLSILFIYISHKDPLHKVNPSESLSLSKLCASPSLIYIRSSSDFPGLCSIHLLWFTGLDFLFCCPYTMSCVSKSIIDTFGRSLCPRRVEMVVDSLVRLPMVGLTSHGQNPDLLVPFFLRLKRHLWDPRCSEYWLYHWSVLKTCIALWWNRLYGPRTSTIGVDHDALQVFRRIGLPITTLLVRLCTKYRDPISNVTKI